MKKRYVIIPPPIEGVAFTVHDMSGDANDNPIVIMQMENIVGRLKDAENALSTLSANGSLEAIEYFIKYPTRIE